MKRKRILCNLLVLQVLSTVSTTLPTSAYAEMYMWKDSKGTFNAEEIKPDWWPPDNGCIVWVSGKENKVLDEVGTRKVLEKCRKDIELKKEKEKVERLDRGDAQEVSMPENTPAEPTDREIRIFCAYQEALTRFVHEIDPEKAGRSWTAKKFKIPKEQVKDILTKVEEYTKGISPCTL